MSPDPTTQFDPAQLTADQAEIVLRSIRIADPDTLNDLEILRRHAVAVPVAGRLLAEPSASDDLLYAASTVWASSGTDPAPLRPLLRHADPTLRLIAAAGCAARGDRAGLPVLIDCLSVDTLLAGSRPPLAAWLFASRVLVRFTARADLGPPMDADPEMRGEAQTRWQAWLTAAGEALVFDAVAGRWR